jgi:hypothetical protein
MSEFELVKHILERAACNFSVTSNSTKGYFIRLNLGYDVLITFDLLGKYISTELIY